MGIDLAAINQWPPPERRALALVAVVACAARVTATASRGNTDNDGLALDHALFAAAADRSPGDWQALFPDPSLYRQAASQAVATLKGKVQDRQTPLYLFQLLALAERLDQQPAIRNALGSLLDDLDEDQSSLEPQALASIYQATISKLGQRIQVSGDPQILQREDSAASIRALLLAGVRFAWLWRSLGGRRRHLIFGRRKLVQTIQSIQEAL